MKDFFELGRILKPQGIKGEIKIEPYTDTLERFIGLKNVFLNDNDRYISIPVEKVRIDDKFAYLKLSGINNYDFAEEIRNQIIYIDRENAAPLPSGSFYIADLIGMYVYDDNNCLIGRLEDIIKNGAADVYVIKLQDGKTLSFPSVDGVIIERNINTGKMVLNNKRLAEVGIYDN